MLTKLAPFALIACTMLTGCFFDSDDDDDGPNGDIDCVTSCDDDLSDCTAGCDDDSCMVSCDEDHTECTTDCD